MSWEDAYAALWHRCRAKVPALTVGLPTPHQLRTGEGPSEVMDRLRRGHHLDVEEVPVDG